MAPKKSTATAKTKEKNNKLADQNNIKPNETAADTGAAKDSAAIDKTKDGPESTNVSTSDKKPNGNSKKRSKGAPTSEPQKAARRSGRGATKGEPNQQQLLNYLLSPGAAELTRPDDEAEDVKTRGDIRTYSASVLNPFEELLCAVILSRPISHRLGLRTIRTVLNDPYNFTSARALKDAGDEKRLQSVYDARTQHKDKTAAQMGIIADAVLENFTSPNDKDGTQLQKLRDDCGDDVDQAAETLRKSIKGLGQTGLEIFFRRVQWIWTASFPNIDGRTADSLKMLGLPQDSEELEKLVGEHWKKLETKHLAGDDEKARKRRAFVVLLERATGAQLEHKIDDMLVAAAQA